MQQTKSVQFDLTEISKLLTKYILYAKSDIREEYKTREMALPEHFATTLNFNQFNELLKKTIKKNDIKSPPYVKLSKMDYQFVSNIIGEYYAQINDLADNKSAAAELVNVFNMKLENFNSINSANSANSADNQMIKKLNEQLYHTNISKIFAKYNKDSFVSYVINYKMKNSPRKHLADGTPATAYFDTKNNDLLVKFKKDNPHIIIEFFNIGNNFIKQLAFELAEIAIDGDNTIDVQTLLRANNINWDILVKCKVEKPPKKNAVEKSADKSTEKHIDTKSEEKPEEKTEEKLADIDIDNLNKLLNEVK